MSNIAVVRGTITSDPLIRELPAGASVVQFDVTTTVRSDGADRNVSVPVARYDPAPTQLDVIVRGSEVVVVGSVRRRFFRVGGATQSRTEIVAEAVVPARLRRQVATALAGAADRIAAIPAR